MSLRTVQSSKKSADDACIIKNVGCIFYPCPAQSGLSVADGLTSIVPCVLQEYISSQDLSEAAECLRKLAVPFFHHEVVKQSLLLAITSPQHQAAMLRLLSSLSASGEISLSQLSRVRHVHVNSFCKVHPLSCF